MDIINVAILNKQAICLSTVKRQNTKAEPSFHFSAVTADMPMTSAATESLLAMHGSLCVR